MENSLIADLPKGFHIGTIEDLPLILLTMAQAFADYEYPVPTTEISYSGRLRFNYDLLSYVTKNAFEHGLVLTNEDFSAVLICVLLKDACVPPLNEVANRMKKYASIESVENMCAIFNHIGELEKGLSFKEDTVYVECFAVQTPRQGQKLGSMLMRQLFAECDTKGRDILLYTNTIKNREIYEHLGFECILEDHEENLNSDTYFLIRRT